MRVLPVAEKWEKLHPELPIEQRPMFSTYRFPRKDAPKGRDWHQGETVQIVYRSRSKISREDFGDGLIVTKTPTELAGITDAEAIADGFPEGWQQMANWMRKAHKGMDLGQPINKLMIRWVK